MNHSDKGLIVAQATLVREMAQQVMWPFTAFVFYLFLRSSACYGDVIDQL